MYQTYRNLCDTIIPWRPMATFIELDQNARAGTLCARRSHADRSSDQGKAVGGFRAPVPILRPVRGGASRRRPRLVRGRSGEPVRPPSGRHDARAPRHRSPVRPIPGRCLARALRRLRRVRLRQLVPRRRALGRSRADPPGRSHPVGWSASRTTRRASPTPTARREFRSPAAGTRRPTPPRRSASSAGPTSGTRPPQCAAARTC
jgi:hypothetical protein